MITNHLLEAKYQIQKKLEVESGHNIRTYIKNIHRIVEESERKYGLKFKYGNIQRTGLYNNKVNQGSREISEES